MIKDASIEIIQKCLNKCIHCSSCSTAYSEARMPPDVIDEVFQGLVNLGTQRVCLSGGEPCLHPEIVRIVQRAKELGLSVDIYSSGIVGDIGAPQAFSREFCQRLAKAGVGTIMFNLQSPSPEEYDYITGTRSHFRYLLKSVRTAREAGIRCEIHFVPMACNYGSVEEVINFAHDLDIAQVNYLELVPHGRATKHLSEILLSDQQLNWVRHTLGQLKEDNMPIRIGLPLQENRRSTPCHSVAEKLYIKYDGSVFGCEAFKYLSFNEEGKAINPDNVYNDNIEHIWKNSEYLRKSLALIKEYSGIMRDCESCPVQKYLRGKGMFGYEEGREVEAAEERQYVHR